MKTALLFGLVLFGPAAALFAEESKQENKAENLKALFDRIGKAARDGDEKAAVALTKSLICDEARIKKALKDDADKDFVAKVVEMHKSLLASEDSKLAKTLSPGDPKRTEVQVHGATTEEIAKYEKDSVAFKEFPGGAQKIAQTVLRPGTTFYEVEFVEPGKDAGVKYHLLFWDGERWSMLGAVWRADRGK